MTNEHYLEVAKECGFDMMTIAPSIVIDAEQLSAYTARICAEKDAEIERYKRIESKVQSHITDTEQRLSAANAAIAMKDEALKAIVDSGEIPYCESNELIINARKALSTSPESLAAWEAEKLSDGKLYSAMSSVAVLKQNTDLQRQVAMLAEIVSSIHNEYLSKGFIIGANALKEILSNTQATAEAYEREHAARVWDDASTVWNLCACCWSEEQIAAIEEVSSECSKKAAELRNK